MKKHLRVILCLLVFSKASFGGFFVGGNLNVYNFFAVTGGPDISSSGGFGTGAIFAGYSLGDVLAVDVFLSSDTTGALTGSGTLGNQTGTLAGSFSVLSYGIEARLAPPVLPFFFKVGIGLGSTSTDITLNNTALFTQGLNTGSVIHAGLGLKFGLPILTIFGGLDGVWVSLSDPSNTVTSFPGILYFRTNVGVIYKF